MEDGYFTLYQDARSYLCAIARTAPPDDFGRYSRIRMELDKIHGGTGFPAAQPVGEVGREDLVTHALRALEKLRGGVGDRLGLELCIADLEAAWADERGVQVDA